MCQACPFPITDWSGFLISVVVLLIVGATTYVLDTHIESLSKLIEEFRKKKFRKDRRRKTAAQSDRAAALMEVDLSASREQSRPVS
jgi:Sec-independent protein translocase protein TatA